MESCANCKYSEPICGGLACMGQKGMPFVIASDYCENWKTTKLTNADRIRSMTDEELGFLIAWNSYETPPWCREHEECPFIGLDHVPCEKCALDWLKQETAE